MKLEVAKAKLRELHLRFRVEWRYKAAKVEQALRRLAIADGWRDLGLIVDNGDES